MQAEVGAHVDHPRARAQPAGGLGRAHAMRQTAEHRVDAFCVGLGLELALELEQRKHRRERLAGKRARGELAQLHARVASEEMNGRHPRITIGTRDGDLHVSGHERMSIRIRCINMRFTFGKGAALSGGRVGVRAPVPHQPSTTVPARRPATCSGGRWCVRLPRAVHETVEPPRACASRRTSASAGRRSRNPGTPPSCGG